MEQENEKFLKDSLFYLGFGERLNEKLEKAMQKGDPEFKLDTLIQHDIPHGNQQDNAEKHNMFFELSFKKGKKGDRYFFNSYKAKLVRPDQPDKTQVFYINKSKGVTTKEAFNLLSGRAVNKDLVNREGKKYNAWMQLNFEEKDKHGNNKVKLYHENYGYNIEKALDNTVTKKNIEGQRDILLQSLKKGNIVPVILNREGGESRGYIAANPQSWSMRLFDENGAELIDNRKNRQQAGQSTAPAKKKPAAQKRKTNSALKGPRVRKEATSKGRGRKP